MSCAYDKERLTGYFDGELETPEKADVEKHISTCSECLRELGEIKSAALLIRDLPRQRAPAKIGQAVAREVALAGRVHLFSRARLGALWVLAAAAGVLVMATIVLFEGAPGKKEESLALSRPSAAERKMAPLHADAPPPMEQAARAAQDRPAVEKSPSAFGAKAEDEGLHRKEMARRESPTDSKLAKEDGAPDKLKETRGLGAAAADKGNAKPGEPPPPPREELAKRAEPSGRAASPSAPPSAPAPPPAAVEGQLLQAETLEQSQKQIQPGDYTLSSPDPASARSRLLELLARFSSGPGQSQRLDQNRNLKDSDSTFLLDLTDLQISELKTDLERQPGTRLVPGLPAAAAGALRGRERDNAQAYGQAGVTGEREKAKNAPSVAAAAQNKDAALKTQKEQAEAEAKGGNQSQNTLRPSQQAGPAAPAPGNQSVQTPLSGGQRNQVEIRRRIVLHLVPASPDPAKPSPQK